LTTLMIAVEQINHEPLTLVDAARERIPLRLLPVPQRPVGTIWIVEVLIAAA
jgi:hypothetical protein